MMSFWEMGLACRSTSLLVEVFPSKLICQQWGGRSEDFSLPVYLLPKVACCHLSGGDAKHLRRMSCVYNLVSSLFMSTSADLEFFPEKTLERRPASQDSRPDCQDS